MPEFTLMSYNIQHMNKMFENNVIKQNQIDRAQKIANVILNNNPHVLGICEAPNDPDEHQHFIDNYLSGASFKLAHGSSRGAQNLVFYYRDPFIVESIDSAIDFYEPWVIDIDNDGLKEHHKFYRKPLEVVFKIGASGPKLRIIIVHTKSKAIFDVVDFHNFQKISLADRKRLVAQAYKLRERLDELIQEANPIPFIILGDMNDGPGLDPYEKILGRSFVETTLGSVYKPVLTLHNALWWRS